MEAKPIQIRTYLPIDNDEILKLYNLCKRSTSKDRMSKAREQTKFERTVSYLGFCP